MCPACLSKTSSQPSKDELEDRLAGIASCRRCYGHFAFELSARGEVLDCWLCTPCLEKEKKGFETPKKMPMAGDGSENEANEVTEPQHTPQDGDSTARDQPAGASSGDGATQTKTS